MATATFKLSGLTVPQLVGKVRDIIVKMTTHAATYPTPTPTLVVLSGEVDALDTAYQEALANDRIKKAQMRLARKKLLSSMSILLAYVQMTSAGEADKINLVAEVKKNATPVGILNPPANVRTFYGYQPGDIRLVYKGIPGRLFYRAQINDTPGNNSGWKDYLFTTKTRIIVSGLTPGAEYGFRIATVSTGGIGEWSDPVLQKAQP